MASKTLVPVEEYLRTIYHPDREYWDGEIVERNVGEKQHAAAQGRLIGILFMWAEQQNVKLFVNPELRLKLGETLYLIPDVCVFAGEDPEESVPTQPPYVVVEILSPDDRMKEVVEKLELFRNWGVANIWFVDPYSKKLFVYTEAGLLQVAAFQLPQFGLEIPASRIFPR